VREPDGGERPVGGRLAGVVREQALDDEALSGPVAPGGGGAGDSGRETARTHASNGERHVAARGSVAPGHEGPEMGAFELLDHDAPPS
jgi:hypothetical protein